MSAQELRGKADPFRSRGLMYLGGLLDDVDRGAEGLLYVREAIEEAHQLDPALQTAVAMGLGAILSERADPEAAVHARAAIDLSTDPSRDLAPDRLASALATAGMSYACRPTLVSPSPVAISSAPWTRRSEAMHWGPYSAWNESYHW